MQRWYENIKTFVYIIIKTAVDTLEGNFRKITLGASNVKYLKKPKVYFFISFNGISLYDYATKWHTFPGVISNRNASQLLSSSRKHLSCFGISLMDWKLLPKCAMLVPGANYLRRCSIISQRHTFDVG